jgi:hemerythrin-like domain-containing protein
MDRFFRTPGAGFDHPFDMLDGCHGRIRQNCERIQKIAAHLASKGADEEARDAAHAVVRFFDTAGAAHHRDEEEDLFPALLACVPCEELAAAQALIEGLRADHEKLDRAWHDMRRALLLLAAVGNTGLTLAYAREFRALYEQHIAREEAEMLPLARRVLEPAITTHLGARMAARRGVRGLAR